MKNIKKIEINGHYVWVDKDAEIEIDNYAFHFLAKKIQRVKSLGLDNDYCKHQIKIISASPELNLEGVPTYVEWLAEQEYPNANGSSKLLVSGFIKGYQTAEKELLTWDDVRKAIELGRETTHHHVLGVIDAYDISEIIEQLKQNKK